MVLTDEAQTDMYPAATMETAEAATEETYYSNLPDTRVNPPTGYPANTPSGNAKVAKVGAGLGEHKVGPAIILKVMAGDKFNLTVNSWYKKNGASPNSPTSPLSDLLSALATGIAGTGGAHGATSTEITSSGILTSGVTSFLSSQSSASGKPKAYVNWILFDEQFNYVSSTSGFEQVGADDTYTTHTQTNMPVSKNGFLYIYVSNETPNIPVFFDNLQVTHVRGQLLEETHYYPFGLTMAGISSKSAGGMSNKKKYNGIEYNTDFDINSYEAFYRNLDPQIGRFWQIDPKLENTETWSPYASMLDNPIKYSDLLGDSVGIEDNSYFDNKKGVFVEQINMTVTGKVINESSKVYTSAEMEEIAYRINESVTSTYSDVSENSTTTVTANISVATTTNPEVKSDHLFILRDEGSLPDSQNPGGFRPMGVVGHSSPGEKGIYLATKVIDGIPATTGAYAGTGKTSNGGATLERTASHELGHSLYEDGGSDSFVGHPQAGTKPGNLMNQTGQPDAGMQLTPEQRKQIIKDFNAGKLNGGRQRY